jgi:hypothetical protein
MFRRRPFVLPFRWALAVEVPPLLRRANQLMASGDYPAAADAFEELGRGAQARGRPRAARPLLQAGRCQLLAGQVPAGIALLKQGLSLLAERGQVFQVQTIGGRLLAELRQRGLAAEAADLEAYLQSLLPGGSTATPAAASAEARHLPTHCPACGGPLRSDEVEWADEVTAECPYCGSAVRVE